MAPSTLVTHVAAPTIYGIIDGLILASTDCPVPTRAPRAPRPARVWTSGPCVLSDRVTLHR